MIRLICSGLLVGILLPAASTKVWEIRDRADFLPGDFSRVSLDPEGRLQPSPPLEELFTSEEAVAWDAVRDDRGRLWVATGHHGQLFRVDDGGAKPIWKAPEIEIFALAAAPGGGVYAGTSPHGKLYRVAPDGEAEELFDPGQEYIWSVAVSSDGAVLVGTGGEGKIFRVTPSGEGEEYYDTGQRHVVSLAFDGAGALLAGTDPNGVLFRVDAPGKAFALYDSSLPEVRAVAPLATGDIAFAAMGGGISLSDQLTQAIQQAATFAVTTTASPSSSGSPQSAATQPTPLVLNQPAVNYGVETSGVFLLRPDAKIDQLWSTQSENVLGMVPDPRDSGRFLFVTDTDARLRRLDDQDRETLISEAAELQATGLRVHDAEIIVPSAHPARVHRLASSGAASGTYTTGVHDASSPAQWGRLTWRGSGAVEIQTRSGNTAQPGPTWSDWSAAISGAGGGLVTSPSGRYLQWRARLSGGSSLEGVRVAYLPQNQMPVIENISVTREAPDSSSSSGSSSSSSSSSTGAYTISVTATADGGSKTSAASNTETAEVGGVGNGKLAVSWSASDPDSDPLRAKVEFRGEGESAWKTLKADVEESKVTLDGQSLADGRYWFRVTVSDAAGNPPEAARTAQRTSAPVRIDHTPPTVRLVEGLRFEAEDAASPLRRAEYSINAGPWAPLYADDGVIDAATETFTVPEPEPSGAERLLTLRVWDAAGNAGLAKTLLQP